MPTDFDRQRDQTRSTLEAAYSSEPHIDTDNPYTPAGSPLFYGRDATMRALLKDEQAAQSVVLLGGRRCGKTAVLRHVEGLLRGHALGRPLEELWHEAVPDADRPPGNVDLAVHWPVIINFQGIDFDSYRTLLRYIADELTRSLPSDHDLTLPPPQEIHHADDLEDWLRAADSALTTRGHGGIALLIDEVESLFQYDWHHDLMAFLRRLDDSGLRGRVWVVLVGTDRLDRYRSPIDGSPPLNIMRRVRLPDLDYRARRRMLIEPFLDRGRSAPDDEIATRIDALAGGNVWLLANLLEALFEAPAVTMAEVDAASEEVRDNLMDVFSRWARALDDDGWQVYQRIVEAGSLPTRTFVSDQQRTRRQLLEYSGLVHRRRDARVEPGPMLFLDWAVDNGKIDRPNGERPSRDPDGEHFAPGRYRYDIAISYAVPQLEVAEPLARKLEDLGLEVFFDKHIDHELWGVDLNRHLPRSFDRDARVAVMLLSPEYIERYWPMLECRTLIERAAREGWGAILAVSIGDTVLPGIPDSIVVHRLDSDAPNLDEVALKLFRRLRATSP